MQREEFESLTGIRPTLSLYAVIEKEYMASGKDKKEFCRDYELNVDGIAERIQYLADCEEVDRIQDFECRIAELQAQLDKQQAWSSPKTRVLRLALDMLEMEIRDKCGRVRDYAKRGLDFPSELATLEPLLEEWKAMKSDLILCRKQEERNAT